MAKLALSVALCAALLVPTAAFARDRDDATPKGDPNKVVCRSEGSTGSRLSQSKRCMTLANWALEKASSRQEIERIQMNRYKNN